MIKSLILYFQFFTRIPIAYEVTEPVDRMKSGVKYFSLFGLLVGCIEGFFFFICVQLLPMLVTWVLVLLFDVFLTGGFHLDALADMADGLFSARKKEQMLSIMKDSRVGSNGVLALIFYYSLLVTTFYAYSDQFRFGQLFFLICGFSLIGKTSIALLFYHMRYAGASTHGLGQTFVGVKIKDIVISQLITLVFLGLTFHLAGVLTYGGVMLVTCGYRQLVYRKVGGLNGDTLGAAASISQVVYLLILSRLGG